MINSQCNINSKKSILKSFTGREKTRINTPLNSADMFIASLDKIYKKEQNGNFITKYFWSITALILSAIPVLGYELGAAYKFKKLKKNEQKLEFDMLRKSFKKNFKFVFAGGMLLYFGLEYLFNSFNNKNYTKLENEFKKINTSTDAKLAGTFRASYLGAYCTSASGNIKINRNIMNDPISSRSLKKLIKHELVHARQFETIARSKDGIKKLNYADIMQVIKNTQKSNNLAASGFIQIYNDINSDKTGKYDNKKINILGEVYDFKKYTEAIYILLTNPKATYSDIPIAIDEEHYKKVIEKKGPLTAEEEKKADEYYKAMLDYSTISAINAFNPMGQYRKNILEKEAYKENPSLFMKLFEKD